MGYSPWGGKELDMTEHTHTHTHTHKVEDVQLTLKHTCDRAPSPVNRPDLPLAKFSFDSARR